jgi:hypothetical protein
VTLAAGGASTDEYTSYSVMTPFQGLFGDQQMHRESKACVVYFDLEDEG